MENREEKLLILNIQEGNEKALHILLEKYRRELLHYYYTLSADPVDAEDMAQEVLLKLSKKIGHIKPEENFKSYLFKMAKNHLIDSIRKKSKENKIIVENADFEKIEKIYWERQKEATLEEKEKKLKDCLKKLPEKMKNAIETHYFKKQTCQQIGEKIKKNASYIRTLLSRGRKLLATCIHQRTTEEKGEKG